MRRFLKLALVGFVTLVGFISFVCRLELGLVSFVIQLAVVEWRFSSARHFLDCGCRCRRRCCFFGLHRISSIDCGLGLDRYGFFLDRYGFRLGRSLRLGLGLGLGLG